MTLVEENDTCRTNKVVRMGKHDKVRQIVHDKCLDFASCSCLMFESKGIPCCHTLAYLHKILQLHELPDEYILKRWTKSARSGVVTDNNGVEINVEKSLFGRCSALFQRYAHVIDKVIINEEAEVIFCEAMDSAIEKIKPLIFGTSESVLSSARRSINFEGSESVIDKVIINEPEKVRAKGCGKRLKGGKEKAIKKRRDAEKGRRCNGCGNYGQSHDKRNCPLLRETGSDSSQESEFST